MEGRGRLPDTRVPGATGRMRGGRKRARLWRIIVCACSFLLCGNDDGHQGLFEGHRRWDVTTPLGVQVLLYWTWSDSTQKTKRDN